MENKDRAEKHESQPLGGEPLTQACPGKCTNKQIARREALLQAKSSLIDNMIYHIRTLANAVIGFSDLLSTEPLKEDQSEYVREINDAGQGLSVLASEVLDWTRLLSGDLKIEKTKFSLSDILQSIQKMLSWAAHEKGIGYEIVTDPEMPAYLYNDQDRLLKCLVNLTASSIKHTSNGSIQIHIKTEQDGDTQLIRFDVIDTGEGIEPEKFNTIFEPDVYRIEMDDGLLSQLDKGLTVTTGLPLTKQLCELLGGTIEAHSCSGEGSVFTIRIPTGVDSAKTPKLGPIGWGDANPIEAIQEENNVSSRKILLVEDQPSNRTVITLMLEALNVQVVTAENGKVAIEKMEQDSFDLILMDLKMPQMDGYETTRHFREQGVASPIVALSATVLDEKEHQQISTLFDSFLTKPVDSEKLAQTLSKYLKGYDSGTLKPGLVSDESGVSEDETAVIEYEN